MPTTFGVTFARCLSDALDAAGWAADGPHLWRWTYAPLGLSARLLTDRSVTVRTAGGPREPQLVASRMGDPVHAALHVARQLHAIRVAEQALAAASPPGVAPAAVIDDDDPPAGGEVPRA